MQEQKRKSLASRLSSFFSSLKKRLASTSLTTYFLFCVFGVGSWIAINGVWAELPILVITQPECFKLAATLTLIIQIANIGPLVYSVVKVIWHRLHLRDFNLEVAAVFVIVGVGIVSSLLLGIFWNQTAVIGGKIQQLCIIHPCILIGPSRLHFLCCVCTLHETLSLPILDRAVYRRGTQWNVT